MDDFNAILGDVTTLTEWRPSVCLDVRELQPAGQDGNHLWAMERGEESLRLELRRRRGARSSNPIRPPGPTFARPTKLLAG